MNIENEQFDGSISEEFTKDLKSLFESRQSVSPQIDRAVMDQAASRLCCRKNRRFVYGSVCAAVAVAVIIIGFLFLDPSRNADMDRSIEPAAVRMDINKDGTVDVLDAFNLARQLKANEPIRMEWDINSDGTVDRQDVDQVAFAAVRLKEEVL